MARLSMEWLMVFDYIVFLFIYVFVYYPWTWATILGVTCCWSVRVQMNDIFSGTCMAQGSVWFLVTPTRTLIIAFAITSDHFNMITDYNLLSVPSPRHHASLYSSVAINSALWLGLTGRISKAFVSWRICLVMHVWWWAWLDDGVQSGSEIPAERESYNLLSPESGSWAFGLNENGA